MGRKAKPVTDRTRSTNSASQKESKRIINRKCFCDNEKCSFSTAQFAHYIPKSLTNDEVKTWLRELIRNATDAGLDKKVKGRNNLRFSTVHVKKRDKSWVNSRGVHLGLIPKTDGTYAIPSRNIVSEYSNHVGDVPRSPLWSFSKSVAMINKENIPPSSGLGDVDTTHDAPRVSKRRRSGDQSDRITTNQGRPPLILMSNFNNVATATPANCFRFIFRKVVQSRLLIVTIQFLYRLYTSC